MKIKLISSNLRKRNGKKMNKSTLNFRMRKTSSLQTPYFYYYHTKFYSIIEYAIIVWDYSPDAVGLFKLQKRTIRSIATTTGLEINQLHRILQKN